MSSSAAPSIPNASRWDRLSTGLKMWIILSIGLLPLGVVAVVASFENANNNREKAEVELWKQRDPLILFLDRCLEEAVLDEEKFAHLDESATTVVDAAVAFAERGTLEPVEDLLRFVTSEAS